MALPGQQMLSIMHRDAKPKEALMSAVGEVQERTSCKRVTKRFRWHLQRRRLYAKWAADGVDKQLAKAWRVMVPLTPQEALSRAKSDEDAPCSLFRYHAAPPAGFVLPPDVIACSYMPDPGMRAHTVRLLKDRWASDAMPLTAIPEHGSNCKARLFRLATQVAIRAWD
eukprot:CAMPEP_0197659996 /NCGR_PEP_ID=MMETSP1338-20131121/49989_1 /TAXON_ID=43686 ORGANISM="Pelagodinium beii, Strain RCC1491" /NCGR_SAMPLE_ID=MMETSP1338 /ASSEMBLY_ACC=CAM_ASM_000754 /LENGTH=167 /DNA_ID=CAMNT_0043237215 /DNA_START=249 /DNA_END=752 /DNA_ORIENTATION=-